MSESAQKPTREEFVKFWENCERRYRNEMLTLRPYSTYIGCLTIYTVLTVLMAYVFDLTQRFWVRLFVIGYFVLVIGIPWIWIRNSSRWARRNFLVCSQCGEEFRLDVNGDWRRPNPKWKVVAQTGTCPKCRYPVIAESAESNA